MQIRWKYLIGVNGALLLLYSLYILASQIWDRRDLLQMEARGLQSLAEVQRDVCFREGLPRPCLPRMVDAMSRHQSGIEIMVLDHDAVVRVSSVAVRVGERWAEPEILAALASEQPPRPLFKEHLHGRVAMLDVTIPVLAPDGTASFAIHVAREMELVEELLREHRLRHTLWALVSMLLIALVLNLITYRWLLRPLDQITGVLAQSRWYQPPDHDGDELQRLRDSVRALVSDAEQTMQEKEGQLTEAQAELVRRERFAALGELTVGLAHELRNPLHIIRGAAELLARRVDNAETAQDVLEEVDRIDRFVNDLLDYTRPTEPQREPIELAPVLQAAVEAVRRTRDEDAIEYRVEADDALRASIDPAHLHQITVNLVSNAAEATTGDGVVTVRATRPADTLSLSVADQGRGIATEDLARVFDPFFTRRPAGIGLGLAIVRRLVELYGGRVEVESTLGSGTTVTVQLPSAPACEEG